MSPQEEYEKCKVEAKKLHHQHIQNFDVFGAATNPWANMGLLWNPVDNFWGTDNFPQAEVDFESDPNFVREPLPGKNEHSPQATSSFAAVEAFNKQVLRFITTFITHELISIRSLIILSY